MEAVSVQADGSSENPTAARDHIRVVVGPSPSIVEGKARWPQLNGIAWWYLAGLSIVVDFSVVPLFVAFLGLRAGLAVAFPLAGCLLAQGSLLAAWLAWGDGPFSRRLRWHWIIAGVLCSVWLLGLMLSSPPHKFREVGFTVALTVPVVSLGAQLPMWIARLLFGWRLVRAIAPSSAAIEGVVTPAEQPLSIRDLLVATLIVAASFAVARLSPAAQQDDEFRFVWGVYMAVAAFVSLIAILPAAAILLRPGPFGLAVRNSLYLAAAPISLLWFVVAISLIYARGALAPWYEYVGASFFFLAYAGTAILAAAVARDQGYQLGWGRGGFVSHVVVELPPSD